MHTGGLERSDKNKWCERGDSNPHGFPRQILSLVRLPIPPLSHVGLTSIVNASAGDAKKVLFAYAALYWRPLWRNVHRR
jgi:hypothetical protein